MTAKETKEFLMVARKFAVLLGRIDRDAHVELGLDPHEAGTFYNWMCDRLFDGDNVGYIDEKSS